MSGYLTVAQVAEEVGVSARTVLRWLDAGELPCLRLPAAVSESRKLRTSNGSSRVRASAGGLGSSREAATERRAGGTPAPRQWVAWPVVGGRQAARHEDAADA